ncbi:hypothetical protein P5673_031920 [Acropora cervicornis]|uniref:ShKT domain-containing protein n=1 Tax=Acropora cervicornis TaxID=6130 RepID=A0AAD9PRZ6_ACRCE|nr:hypothetical protein P5673_031920 [Acropora cervicornis]
MDRLLWACLALLMFCYVQSFTIRDYLRQRELRPLSDERMRDSSSYAREPTLRDLNELSETQLRALLDEGKNAEILVIVPSYHMQRLKCVQKRTILASSNTLQNIAGGRVNIVSESPDYNYRIMNTAGEGPEKPPIAPIVVCKDEDLEHCKNLKMLCDYEDKENRYQLSIAYTKKYCRKTCAMFN